MQITKLANTVAVPAGLSVSPLPVLAPSIGKVGYSSRYAASTLAGADGSAVDSLTSLVDTSPRTLAAPATGQRPILKAPAGVKTAVGVQDKYLRFDGVDDALIQSGTSGAWATLVMLIRKQVATSAGVYNGSSNVFGTIGSTGFLNANAGSAGGGVQVGAGPGLGQNVWGVGIVTQAGASSVVSIAPCTVSSGAITATRTTATGTLGTGTGTQLRLGCQGQGSGYGQVDIADFATYDTALTSTADHDAIIAAMVAAHRDLILNGG